jgi:hypothetical protein
MMIIENNERKRPAQVAMRGREAGCGILIEVVDMTQSTTPGREKFRLRSHSGNERRPVRPKK